MKEIKIKEANQTIFYESLDNGLDIYVAPLTNQSEFIAYYGTYYGSGIQKFEVCDEIFKLNDGVAHFLEHKMFEQEDGINIFDFFNKSGNHPNAFTNTKYTAYLFEGNKDFEKNFEFLLNYVNEPYFTVENVNKEKGIIGEEIKMYDDDIGWVMEFGLLNALLKYDGARVDIAGDIKSIDKITKEELYKIHETFYTPSNMYIVVSGNVDPNKVIEIAKNNKFIKNKNNVKYEIINKKEPIEVNEKEVSIVFEGTQETKFVYGIKVPFDKNLSKYKNILAYKVLLNIVTGSLSLFYEEIKENKLATSLVHLIDWTDDYLLLEFYADSEKPKELLKRLQDELSSYKVTNEEIERELKSFISNLVKASDDLHSTQRHIFEDLVLCKEFIPNKVDVFKELDEALLNRLLKELNFENSSFVIVKPKKG